MNSAELQKRIMAELYQGARCLPEIAEAIDAAPFLVNAELKSLRRQQLVHDQFDRTAHVWKLTDRGYRRLNDQNTMRIV